MSQFLYRYLFVDFWAPVWPNLAASLLLAFLVFISWLLRLHHRLLYAANWLLQGKHQRLAEIVAELDKFIPEDR